MAGPSFRRSRPAELRYFRMAGAVTVAGLALGLWLGWETTGTVDGAASFFFICLVLAVLEISLSFDNAIVNANVLKTMDPLWQKRFLTWGILIAVFGMRIVFPLAIVAIAAKTGPLEALNLAIHSPDTYSQIIHEAHPAIAAFGGAFLMMVALSFFLDGEKTIHWFPVVEQRFAKYSALRGIEVAITLAVMVAASRAYPDQTQSQFVHAAVFGLLAFLAVDLIGALLDAPDTSATLGKAGLGGFLYLEVLDASFSFDGVIGAFALSQNLFVIAIGLGIGAMFVRSMTIMLVENSVLARFCFLEHGAFYAILALACIMLVQPVAHIPEVLTGLIGVILIGAAMVSSLRAARHDVGDGPAKDHTG